MTKKRGLRAAQLLALTLVLLLLCACGKAQAYKVRTAAHEIDRGAFVMVTEASEVFGEGFSAHSGTQE